MSDEKPDTGKEALPVTGSGEVVLRLSKPIMAHGEQTQELKIRPPNAIDYMEIGNPVVVDMNFDPPRITHDSRIVVPMLVRLAGIPPSSVKMMEVQDLADAAWAMTGFFMPASMVQRQP